MKFEECLEAIKTVAHEEAESLGCETEKYEVAPVSKNAYTIVYSNECPKVDIKVFVKENERIELTYWSEDDEGKMVQLCSLHCLRVTDTGDNFGLRGGNFGHGVMGKNLLVDLYCRILDILEN